MLRIAGLNVSDDRGSTAVKDLSLEIRSGEILGIAGVAGNGQDELVEALIGLRKPTSGTVHLGDADTTGHSPRAMNEAGVAFVPADRHRFGLILPFPLTDNLVLTSYYKPPFARGPLRVDAAIERAAEAAVKEYDVRTPSVTVPVSTLSGGNQQKVVVAREFGRDLRLLVLDQPTRGLDVGSIEFIHRQAIAKRDAGAAILLGLGRARRGPRAVRPDRGDVPRQDRGRGRRTDRRQERDRPADGDRRRRAGPRPGRRGRGIGDVTTPPAGGPEGRPGSREPAVASGEPWPWSGRPGRSIALPMVAIAAALVVGAIVIEVSQLLLPGATFRADLPLTAYSALFHGAILNEGAIVNTLVLTAPLVLGGLSVAIGFKAGLFNIGAQGQFLMGALGAVWVGGLLSDASPLVAIPLAVLAGMIGGAVWGFIPGALKALSGAHEVVTTIMLNYIAIATLALLVSGPLKVPGSPSPVTEGVGNAAYPIIIGSNGHLGIVISVIAVVVVWFLLYPDDPRLRDPDRRGQSRCGPLRRDAAPRADRPDDVAVRPAGGPGRDGGGPGRHPLDDLELRDHGRLRLDRGRPAGPLEPVGDPPLGAPVRRAARGRGPDADPGRHPPELVDVLQATILLGLVMTPVLRKVFRLRGAKSGLGGTETITRTYGGEATVR